MSVRIVLDSSLDSGCTALTELAAMGGIGRRRWQPTRAEWSRRQYLLKTWRETGELALAWLGWFSGYLRKSRGFCKNAHALLLGTVSSVMEATPA